MNIIIKHILRVGNQLADYLANMTFLAENKLTFHSFNQLPTLAKGMLNTDKHDIPMIRIRVRNNNNNNRQNQKYTQGPDK